MVVPVPLAHGVEPDHELVPGGEPVEPAGAVVRAGDRVEQRARQPVQHGRLHHPATLVVVEHGEQLVGEVAGDELVVAAERLDEAIGVVGALQRQPGEHEPRSPTLGALAQVVEPLAVQPFGGGARAGRRPRTGRTGGRRHGSREHARAPASDRAGTEDRRG